MRLKSLSHWQKKQQGENYTIKQMVKSRKSLEVRLEKLNEKKKDDVVTFEELGVDRLFVDESHGFKNLFLYTKMRNVAGLHKVNPKNQWICTINAVIWMKSQVERDHFCNRYSRVK